MSPEVFSIFWLLKNEGIDNPEHKAGQMKRTLKEYPHWKTSEAHEREVRQSLYKVLLQVGMKDAGKVTQIANNIMSVIKGRM